MPPAAPQMLSAKLSRQRCPPTHHITGLVGLDGSVLVWHRLLSGASSWLSPMGAMQIPDSSSMCHGMAAHHGNDQIQASITKQSSGGCWMGSCNQDVPMAQFFVH